MRSALFAAAFAATTVSAQIRFPFSRQQHNNNAATTPDRSTRTKDDANTNTNTNTNTNSKGDERRRALSTKLILEEVDWAYAVNASVGTPPQNLTLLLEPSTSSSWAVRWEAYYNNWPYYSDYYPYGAFAPDNSSTFESVDNDTFSVDGHDGYNNAFGDTMRETLWVGSELLPKVTMGLTTSSTTQMGGVLGLGFNDSTTSTGSDVDDVPNVPDHLLTSGLVNSTAYSLWLDDASGETGHVLFGAVDRAAFEAPLIRVPTVSGYYQSSNYYYWATFSDSGWHFPLASLNYSRSGSGAVQQPLIANQSALQEVVVTVDPTYTVSRLPLYLARPIWDLAGAAFDRESGMALIACNAASNVTARLALQLYGSDGPVINMPASDLVLDSYWVSRDIETDTKLCLFGVQNGTDWEYSDEGYSLGAPMLKRMYTVFDLANQEMGFANVKFNSGEEDIVAFPSYAAEIPESTLAIACIDCSDDSSTKSSSAQDGYNPGLSGGPLIGVVVGCIVAGVLLVLGIIFGAMAYARRRQRAKMAAAADQEKGPAVAGEPGQVPSLPPQPPMAAGAGPDVVPQAAVEGGGNVPVHEERNVVSPIAEEQGEDLGAGTARDEATQRDTQTAAEKATASG